MGGGFVWPRIRSAGGAGGLPHAGFAHSQFGGIWGCLRTVPHFMDCVLGNRALQRDGGDGQVCDHQGFGRISNSRSADSGDHHRLRFRRIPRGRRRLWHARSRCGRHDGGVGILAILCLRPLLTGQYSTRRVWRDWRACHHVGANYRTSPRQVERRSGNSLRTDRGYPSRVHDLCDGRLERGIGSVACAPGGRAHIWNSRVPGVELRRGSTQRHP